MLRLYTPIKIIIRGVVANLISFALVLVQENKIFALVLV